MSYGYNEFLIKENKTIAVTHPILTVVCRKVAWYCLSFEPQPKLKSYKKQFHKIFKPGKEIRFTKVDLG